MSNLVAALPGKDMDSELSIESAPCLPPPQSLELQLAGVLKGIYSTGLPMDVMERLASVAIREAMAPATPSRTARSGSTLCHSSVATSSDVTAIAAGRLDDSITCSVDCHWFIGDSQDAECQTLDTMAPHDTCALVMVDEELSSFLAARRHGDSSTAPVEWQKISTVAAKAGSNVNACTTDDFTKPSDAPEYHIDPDDEEMKIAYPTMPFDRNTTEGAMRACIEETGESKLFVANITVDDPAEMMAQGTTNGFTKQCDAMACYIDPDVEEMMSAAVMGQTAVVNQPAAVDQPAASCTADDQAELFARDTQVLSQSGPLGDGPPCSLVAMWSTLGRGTQDGGSMVGTIIKSTLDVQPQHIKDMDDSQPIPAIFDSASTRSWAATTVARRSKVAVDPLQRCDPWAAAVQAQGKCGEEAGHKLSDLVDDILTCIVVPNYKAYELDNLALLADPDDAVWRVVLEAAMAADDHKLRSFANIVTSNKMCFGTVELDRMRQQYLRRGLCDCESALVALIEKARRLQHGGWDNAAAAQHANGDGSAVEEQHAEFLIWKNSPPHAAGSNQRSRWPSGLNAWQGRAGHRSHHMGGLADGRRELATDVC